MRSSGRFAPSALLQNFGRFAPSALDGAPGASRPPLSSAAEVQLHRRRVVSRIVPQIALNVTASLHSFSGRIRDANSESRGFM